MPAEKEASGEVSEYSWMRPAQGRRCPSWKISSELPQRFKTSGRYPKKLIQEAGASKEEQAKRRQDMEEIKKTIAASDGTFAELEEAEGSTGRRR